MRALALALCLLAAPAAALADPDAFNRVMLRLNARVLESVLEPAARGWNAVVPKVLQRRVVDFVANLEAPRDATNSLLQGKLRRAAIHAGCFLLNSTAGVAGFYDWCGRRLAVGAPPETGDETLGVWGVPAGPYVILPLLGEASARSLAAAPVDLALAPAAAALRVVRDVNVLAQRMPSPCAPAGEWVAYEQARLALPPYEVGRELFRLDRGDRVAE